MGAAALGAEVLKDLESLGGVGLVLVLCFLAYAVWLSRKAFQTGRSVEVKITLHSLEYRIGAKEDAELGAQLPERGELQAAVAADMESAERSVDETAK